MGLFRLITTTAIVAVPFLGVMPAHAETCLEQIVALQPRVNAVTPKPHIQDQPQSLGAQLDHEPTPSSVEQAEGDPRGPAGPAAALNAAMTFQAAGDEASCLKAVQQTRQMLDGQ